MKIPFEKWHGCQNDFIVVWLKTSDIGSIDESLKRRAKNLCSKLGDGIGADGILVLETAQTNDFLPKQLMIINSDGSVAENCGNGLRCAAGSVLQKAREQDQELQNVSFKVFDNEFVCQFLLAKKNRFYPYVAVMMPEPIVDSKTTWFAGIKPLVQEKLEKLQFKVENFHGVEVYNRHLVVFLNERSTDNLLIQCAKEFQTFFDGEGLNVHFVIQTDTNQTKIDECKLNTGGDLEESLDVFVYERGAGVTRACGSGAVAVASLSIAAGFIDSGGFVGLKMPGGELYVTKGPGTNLKLVGPAVKVFDGVLDL